MLVFFSVVLFDDFIQISNRLLVNSGLQHFHFTFYISMSFAYEFCVRFSLSGFMSGVCVLLCQTENIVFTSLKTSQTEYRFIHSANSVVAGSCACLLCQLNFEAMIFRFHFFVFVSLFLAQHAYQAIYGFMALTFHCFTFGC